MNKILLSTLLLIAISFTGISQTQTGEKYGKTLNLGVGIGYYRYIGNSTPVFHANLELDVARNFTLAPFITYFSYQKYRYWGNNQNEYKNYYYRQTTIPIGLKGTYYFDSFLRANSKWDFYLAASLGFAYRTTRWEDGYNGDYKVENGTSGLYWDRHIGVEYHINQRVGLLLDLSSGISTFCLALHL
jgi:hypothetical protein